MNSNAIRKAYLPLTNCDLDQIAQSGQCFRWAMIAPGEYIVHDGHDQALLKQRGNLLALEYYGDRLAKWMHYLDVETDYDGILHSIPAADKYLRAAADRASGLRILNADPWEIMVSFIISQNNNIPRIRRTVEAMCERLGEPRQGPAGTYYTFPDPADLKDVRRLQGLGLGYRDKYIAQLARNVASGRVKLSKLHTMTTEEAHTYLKSIYGIGEKVSNCILLFGLGRKEAFPVDTWMRKIIGREYGGKFPVELYPETAGVMQQYMFFSERSSRKL